jgi:hypothetical protein
MGIMVALSLISLFGVEFVVAEADTDADDVETGIGAAAS